MADATFFRPALRQESIPFRQLNPKISLNIRSPDAINYCVRRFRNIVFTLAALLWLPASAHCQLESLPGLEFLQCDGDAQAPCDTSKDCGDCGCYAAENSHYNSGQLRFTFPSPEWQVVSFTADVALVNTLPAEVSLGILTAAPPPLLQTWQFVSRAALPVRAPSAAS
jgi:hypothetical protein